MRAPGRSARFLSPSAVVFFVCKHKGPPAPSPSVSCAMGLSSLLLRNHAKLAVPAFVGGSLFGFVYTLSHGQSPYQALKGEPAECREPGRRKPTYVAPCAA